MGFSGSYINSTEKNAAKLQSKSNPAQIYDVSSTRSQKATTKTPKHQRPRNPHWMLSGIRFRGFASGFNVRGFGAARYQSSIGLVAAGDCCG